MMKQTIPCLILLVAGGACAPNPSRPLNLEMADAAIIADCQSPNTCLFPEQPPELVVGSPTAFSTPTESGYSLVSDGTQAARFVHEFCEPDFSQYDFAAFTAYVSVDVGEADVRLGVAARTEAGAPNGNMSLLLARDGTTQRYTAMIPLAPGTECLDLIAAVSDGAFALTAREPKLRLFPNDEPVVPPALGPDNAWYAQRIIFMIISGQTRCTRPMSSSPGPLSATRLLMR